ncbi:hypothetical protein [Streptomyces wuyuanensis]|uniref:Uncharacterized protein n=1 Tax=Streptomyces wuyuanensis TaxID=1196353 RepID=A0A1G9NB36_9ACTN|nr:hypothetical protein [Streptomyces wuyuanensis]SDL83327.1 hypothetical protein SAMN05444921_101567 [Streptomyces wuyuanensis]
MRKILEFAGMALLVVGVCGVLRELTGGWFAIMGFTRWLIEPIGFLNGRELYVHLVLAALGVAALARVNRAWPASRET